MLKKRISIIERRAGMTPDEFDAHWAGPHVPIVRLLPGLEYYVQHHLVAGQEELRAQKLDGIAEVLFDAPENQPSNTHTSDAQQQDELEFVTAMTAIPILEPVQHFAPYSVWIVSRADLDGSELTVAGASHISTERRDDAQPVMTRAHLGTEAEPTRTYIKLAFETLDAADAAYRDLSARDELLGQPRSTLRIALTESTRML